MRKSKKKDCRFCKEKAEVPIYKPTPVDPGGGDYKDDEVLRKMRALNIGSTATATRTRAEQPAVRQVLQHRWDNANPRPNVPPAGMKTTA